MKKVLMLTGPSHGNALDGIAAGFAPIYEAEGYEFHLLSVSLPGGADRLKQLLIEGNVAFAIAMAGIHGDPTLTRPDGVQDNLWKALRIPFISLLGDAPFYFFDRHVNLTTSHALGYSFADHLMLRKRLPAECGVSFVIPPAPLNMDPFEQVDFGAKLNGKLLFLKNGNDPKALVAQWKRTLSPSMSEALLEIAEALTAGEAIDHCYGTSIDDAVLAYFGQAGIDIESMPRLRLLLCAHLDDYVRRIKSNMMAEVLSDYPVVINGFNWEHLDFSNKRCTFIPGADWNRSRKMIRSALGMIDMSPNTAYGLHDRIVRSLGAHTICLTNEQHFFTEAFPDIHERMTFRFNKASIAERVEHTLANPRETINLGALAAEQFRQRFTPANLARCTILVADAIRLSIDARPVDTQEFIVWPPINC